MLGNLGPYWVDIIDTTLEKNVFFLGTPKALRYACAMTWVR